MAEHRRTSGATGEMESRDVSRYLGHTNRVCPTCTRATIYIKMKHETSSDLECANCDLVITVPKGTEDT